MKVVRTPHMGYYVLELHPLLNVQTSELWAMDFPFCAGELLAHVDR